MVAVAERLGVAVHDQAVQVLGGVAGHLLGGLGARRDRLVVAVRLEKGAVADHEHPVVALGLQGRGHFDLVDPVECEAFQLADEIRCLDAGGPYHEVGADGFVVLGDQCVLGGARHHHAGTHRHAERFQAFLGGGGHPLGEAGQNPRQRFHHRHLELLAVQVFVAVQLEHGHRMVDFRRQLDAGGAAADDRHGHRLVAVVGVQAGVHKALAEALRLGAGIHEQAVVAHPGGAEVVALAAHGDHQIVVEDLAFGEHFVALGVDDRVQGDGALVLVDPGHVAGFKAIVIEAGVGAVVHRIQVRVDGAGGDFVEARLPDVHAAGVHQGDVGVPELAQFASQLGDQGQAAGATADHHDLWFAHSGAPCIKAASLTPRGHGVKSGCGSGPQQKSPPSGGLFLSGTGAAQAFGPAARISSATSAYLSAKLFWNCSARSRARAS